MHPPSPKAMEDRGIINYGRCRACGTTNKMLDASSLSLLCMTAMYYATETKTYQTRHSERSEESRITAATNAPLVLPTVFLKAGVERRKLFNFSAILAKIAGG